MILRSLTAQGFRNLGPEEICFHPQANLIVGQNGQGKTNLLEAIYFLATTKSFRTSRVASLFRFGGTSVFASGVLHRSGLEKTLSVGLEAGESRRRALLVNGERVSLANYVNAISVFAYSSARLEILRGVPEERRRFLDRGIASIDHGYLENITRYARVLRQRNALLQSGSAGGSALDVWDEEFVQSATALQQARARYTGALQEAFTSIVTEHDYRVDNVRMEYRPASVAGLRALRTQELRARVSLAGPQRDLLDFTVAGRPVSEVLSGGEQKMVVLFLKFAKLALFRQRYDEPAVFLLDDIDAELDFEILETLLARLPRATQVFATSAKDRLLRTLETGPHRRLIVDQGRVTAPGDF